MSKVLVIPDLHLKTEILDEAMKIVEIEQVDECVFLGDYGDDWNQTHNLEKYLDTIEKITNFVEKVPTHLLLGNHDVAYFIESYEHYSLEEFDHFQKYKELLKNLQTSIACKIDDVVYSHAGVLTEYDDFYKISPDLKMLKELYFDPYSPLWIRPNQLIGFDHTPKLQVVGHTPVKKITKITDNNCTFYCTDVFSTYPNPPYNPVGIPSFLIVENGSPRIYEV